MNQGVSANKYISCVKSTFAMYLNVSSIDQLTFFKLPVVRTEHNTIITENFAKHIEQVTLNG